MAYTTRSCTHLRYPVAHDRIDVRPGRGRHTPWERVDVVLSEAARLLVGRGVVMRLHLPARLQDAPMDLTHFGKCQEILTALGPGRCECLAVDPLRSISISL